MKRCNEEIRKAMEIYEISQTELARFVGRKHQSINRALQKEMRQEKKLEMLDAINRLARVKGKEKTGAKTNEERQNEGRMYDENTAQQN